MASASLNEIYAIRPDLQAAFDEHGAPIGTAAGFLMNFEDWARQYGWQEYPELAGYAPAAKAPVSIAHAVAAPNVTSYAYVVVDDASGAILAAQHAERSWPIASITKLMTTEVALDGGLDVGGTGSVRATDDVGGAKLHVTDGTKFTTRDLLAATLVGSANNAANAVARLSGMQRVSFVNAMNARAKELGLSRTTFVDPTGIEVENVSTAREVAAFADDAFNHDAIRTFCGSSKTVVSALNDAAYVRTIQNTNWMLYDPAYDDIYVTAGKTGFLYESGWNVVVQMHPMGEDMSRSLTIVLLGADGRRESFDDAAALARWAWRSMSWK
ncbi:MAG: serine hydrolase [Candidatus Uhrbacteria bacterium]|nr:serine hydrolase [Candidatus Uhrbacteria bacterium]